jgi:hypothetical protein
MLIGKQTDVDRVAEQSELKRLLKLDTTPWYRKPNLRGLYLCLVPAVLGVETTSGYDGSILNGLQAVGPWLACMESRSAPASDLSWFANSKEIVDFNNPQGAILGIINAAFSIGAVIALPVVPYVCHLALCRESIVKSS